MSEEILPGDASLPGPVRVPENIHRVRQADADDSRNARESFEDTQEEQENHETAGRDPQDKNPPEKPLISVRHGETIHDEIILSETAQRLTDQSKPAESDHDKADEKSPKTPVPRIHLTA